MEGAALRTACVEGADKIVKILLDHPKIDVNPTIDASVSIYCTMLHYARPITIFKFRVSWGWPLKTVEQTLKL